MEGFPKMSDQNGAAPRAPAELRPSQDQLSRWWPRAVIATLAIGFTVLILLTIKVHYDAPPIPDQVVDPRGTVVFSKADIQDGQEVFLKYGLMNNGSIWGHGGYLGPDFSASYLHNLAVHLGEWTAKQRYGKPLAELAGEDRAAVEAAVRFELKQNRFDPDSGNLTFTDGQTDSYRRQIDWWADYFSEPGGNGGLPAEFLTRGDELKDLTAFFAWAAWASVTNRPGESFTYTNNFPYDPLVGNVPPERRGAVEWAQPDRVARRHRAGAAGLRQVRLSRLEVEPSTTVVPRLRPGDPTPSQRAVDEVLRHRGVAVPDADAGRRRHGALPRRAGDFYGSRLSGFLPEQCPAHLASAAGHLLDRDRLCRRRAVARGGMRRPPASRRRQRAVHPYSVRRNGRRRGRKPARANGPARPVAGRVWFWFGNQGWEYLELGRAWQIVLAVGAGVLVRSAAAQRGAGVKRPRAATAHRASS